MDEQSDVSVNRVIERLRNGCQHLEIASRISNDGRLCSTDAAGGPASVQLAWTDAGAFGAAVF
jgi:hypothetical protein